MQVKRNSIILATILLVFLISFSFAIAVSDKAPKAGVMDDSNNSDIKPIKFNQTCHLNCVEEKNLAKKEAQINYTRTIKQCILDFSKCKDDSNSSSARKSCRSELNKCFYNAKKTYKQRLNEIREKFLQCKNQCKEQKFCAIPSIPPVPPLICPEIYNPIQCTVNCRQITTPNECECRARGGFSITSENNQTPAYLTSNS